MKTPLIAERSLTINAAPAKVWQVLTDPEYIRHWDDVPPSFGDNRLSLNSTLQWEFEDGHRTILTVTAFEPEQRLKMNLYVTRWPNPAENYNIAYIYTLKKQKGHTLLTITVGDFEDLNEMAESYLDASDEFVQDGGDKIKALAEGK